MSCVNRFTGHGANLNRARLDYFHAVLFAITVVKFVAFVFFAGSYKYKAKEPIMQIKLECASP